ncbi:probable ubiquitin carboxyl-terminal hydrolase MINDY-4 [Clytia hemisphaerica]|uniref:Ubiquitin carboxyl-terminal hydrolase MINDY n=1 Tax=Clytia hemisphaerica TaxID=252671 RepID=A0A7M5UYW2_9CNID
MDKPTTEILSLSLVREYLSRRGYRKTLHAFDKETQKKEQSITNRRTLADQLNIWDLIKQNKKNGDKYQSFYELIVDFILRERKDLKKSSRDSTLKDGSNTSLHDVKHSTPIRCNRTRQSHQNLKECQNDKNEEDRWLSDVLTGIQKDKKVIEAKTKKNDSNNKESFNSFDSVDTKSSKKNVVSHQSAEILAEVHQSFDKPSTSETVDSEFSLSFIEGIRKKKEKKQTVSLFDSLTIDDVDSTEHLSHVTTHMTFDRSAKYHDDVKSITLETAIELKTLIFGNPKSSFNPEWRRQGFYFSTHPDLEYGLMQEKGGPCGLLASVQAWILRYLLFNENGKQNGKVPLSLTREEQEEALIKALTQILWRSKQPHDSQTVIAIPSKSPKFNASPSTYKADNLTERLDLYECKEKVKLEMFLKKNLTLFQQKDGIVLFLYSVVLTYGIKNVKNSTDDEKLTLIGCHGYCTQEMVNLMLVGRAVSNVFDGDKEFGQTLLHGIQSQSPIGFLSLFEHYGSCQVGDHYKNPIFPIWVVCSESHFSVLFTTDDVTKNSTFDLFYFDGLGQQDEEIRLSITPDGLKKVLNDDIDLIPPLDSCIRTKWKNALVSWNDTDPLL